MSDDIRWSFVRHSDAGDAMWLWQRLGPDGRVENTSEPHPSYGKALMAALQNGFRPDQDYYSLDLPYGRMHFPPGRVPEFASAHSALTGKSAEPPALKPPPVRE